MREREKSCEMWKSKDASEKEKRPLRNDIHKHSRLSVILFVYVLFSLLLRLINSSTSKFTADRIEHTETSLPEWKLQQQKTAVQHAAPLNGEWWTQRIKQSSEDGEKLTHTRKWSLNMHLNCIVHRFRAYWIASLAMARAQTQTNTSRMSVELIYKSTTVSSNSQTSYINEYYTIWCTLRFARCFSQTAANFIISIRLCAVYAVCCRRQNIALPAISDKRRLHDVLWMQLLCCCVFFFAFFRKIRLFLPSLCQNQMLLINNYYNCYRHTDTSVLPCGMYRSWVAQWTRRVRTNGGRCAKQNGEKKYHKRRRVE